MSLPYNVVNNMITQWTIDSAKALCLTGHWDSSFEGGMFVMPGCSCHQVVNSFGTIEITLNSNQKMSISPYGYLQDFNSNGVDTCAVAINQNVNN